MLTFALRLFVVRLDNFVSRERINLAGGYVRKTISQIHKIAILIIGAWDD